MKPMKRNDEQRPPTILPITPGTINPNRLNDAPPQLNLAEIARRDLLDAIEKARAVYENALNAQKEVEEFCTRAATQLLQLEAAYNAIRALRDDDAVTDWSNPELRMGE